MLKAIIVDDEAPARSELKFLLDELGQTEVVAEAASVREAIEKLKEYPCDVMFLDVNMPEATGLQLAEALQHLKFPPAVVFVTAYSEHALDAFKVNAIDYLVKPVETERLSQALARVREHVSLHVQAQKSERIPVEKGGKKILIGIDKIRFVMARDDYAYLQTDTDRYFSTESLAQLEKRLDGHGLRRHAAAHAERRGGENPRKPQARERAEEGVGTVGGRILAAGFLIEVKSARRVRGGRFLRGAKRGDFDPFPHLSITPSQGSRIIQVVRAFEGAYTIPKEGSHADKRHGKVIPFCENACEGMRRQPCAGQGRIAL